MLQRLSSSVQQHRGSWGILILALWAITLALVAFARMLALTAAVGPNGQEPLSRGLIWTLFSLNAFFGLGFSASAYGLWMRRHWGRLLFCGLVIIWAVVYITALLIPFQSLLTGTNSVIILILNLLRYVFGVVVPVWYLNLAHIKALFDLPPSNQQTSKPTNNNPF